MPANGPLLGKQWNQPGDCPPEVTLFGHTERVVKSFGSIFGTATQPTRLAGEWLRFFKLPVNSVCPFLANGALACLMHDIGKANTGFQEAVRRSHSDAQVIRHEHLSGIILTLPEVQQWLAATPLIQPDVVLCAVIGHHLKARREDFGQPLNPDRTRIGVYVNAIEGILQRTSAILGAEAGPALSIPEVWTIHGENGIVGRREDLRRRLHQLRHRLRRDLPTHRLLMAVRAALIAADSAGSGLARVQEDWEAWLEKAFREEELLAAEDIEREVIEPRVHEIQSSGKRFKWNDFQVATENLPSRALLLAPCGSGKTLAAWRWCKAQLAKREAKRVIFLYPTRATASEGFRDYVSWAPEADAALVHGTSAYELDGMFENPADQRYHRDFTTNDRLFAIGYWPRRIFSATVDQFLGFMQHVYRSTCLMPVLVDSVLVIDEVHSFDRNLFSALKRFLVEFDLPVLCMTASLPTERRRDLMECGLQLFPAQLDDFADLQSLGEIPRYRVHLIANLEQVRATARAAFRNGNRVLWVVNTVDRCQALAQELDCRCYHSRFTLEDRKARHHDIVAAFQQEEESVLAVTTQVCEMSLDLDADVLISEVAPIASLIQRMGRCNRRTLPQRNHLGKVYVYRPESARPYKDDDLDGVDSFLAALDGQEVSQARLQELLDMAPGRVEPERFAAFLESGPWASAREETLRDINDFTVQAVLDSQVERFLALRRAGDSTDGLLLPAPRKLVRRDDRLGRFPSVASSYQYTSKYGLLRKPVEMKT